MQQLMDASKTVELNLRLPGINKLRLKQESRFEQRFESGFFVRIEMVFGKLYHSAFTKGTVVSTLDDRTVNQ